MHRLSVKIKILFLIIVSYATVMVILGIVSYTAMNRLAFTLQHEDFSGDIDIIMDMLKQKHDDLAATGMADDYQSAFQSSLIDQLSKLYFAGKTNAAYYPYIIDESGIIVMHPSLPRGSTDVTNEPFIAQMLQQRSGSIRYTYKGEKKWSLFRNFDPWKWTVVEAVRESELTKLFHGTIILIQVVMIMLTVVTIAVMYLFLSAIMRPMNHVNRMLRDIASGEADLTKRLDIRTHDEFGVLAASFNTFAEKIRSLLSAVRDNVDRSREQSELLSSGMTQSAAAINEMTANLKSIEGTVSAQFSLVERTETASAGLRSNAANISMSIQQLLGRTDELTGIIQNNATSVEQMASSVEEMNATIESVNNVADKANVTATELSTVSESSKHLMEKTTQNMSGVLTAVGIINEFVGMISNVAAQTNLLAMNAAIEAAHAGEQGKGFAVVAEEIRKLSDISNKQADEAKKSLKAIEQNIKTTARDLEETGRNFSIVSAESQNLSGIVAQVKHAADEQSSGASEMLSAIASISSITGTVKKSYEEITRALSAMKSEFGSFESFAKTTTDSVGELKHLSGEIQTSMNEMGSGAVEVNTAIQEILKLTSKTTESIAKLEDEIRRYTIDAEPVKKLSGV
ncbi:MAG: methyl-accepting chemotaxis protein [Spirochaetota bacterium]